jgi:hypothetical protein
MKRLLITLFSTLLFSTSIFASLNIQPTTKYTPIQKELLKLETQDLINNLVLELNKMTGKNVDQATYLKSANLENNTTIQIIFIVNKKALITGVNKILNTNYTELNEISPEFEKTFSNNILDKNVKTLCSDPINKILLDKGVVYHYLYNWNNEDSLLDISVSATDCK